MTIRPDDRFWWLSFCDAKRPKGKQFLGVSIVCGTNMLDAVRESHRLGCNPGGEVVGIEVPSGWYVPENRIGVLLDRKQAEQVDHAWWGAKP